MSSSASLADYRAALTAPGAAIPVIASAAGRFPIAMLPLATLLYVQRETGSFAAAGLVSAGQMIGVAAGSITRPSKARPARSGPSSCRPGRPDRPR
jgi:hypothetical protein